MTPPDSTSATGILEPVGRVDDGSAGSFGRPARWSFRKLLAAAGPGYLVAIGYMDPGNWATDIAGGSRFGYGLLPAILVANCTAIFLQWLSLRLGIVTGQNLAQLCRSRYSRRTAVLLWAICEIAIVACDLAEIIGTAIALRLLAGVPLALGVIVAGVNTALIMLLERRGLRYLEAFVLTLTGTIGVCLTLEVVWSGPAPSAVLAGLVPQASLLTDPAALYLGLGIFGATVMPHNLYLHSALVQSRRKTAGPIRESVFYSTLDCIFALTAAFFINAAILILAAAAFHNRGYTGVAEIEEAYRLLVPMFGPWAGVLFAIALLAAGQNSTLTGTMAGQITMEGFLDLRMPMHLRRLMTRGLALIPALGVVMAAGEHAASSLLVASQVVLSLQLGFAVIPLVRFTSDPRIMGQHANKRVVRFAA
jgi:manganese transport protein